MWRAYNCKSTDIYYPDGEVSHVLHQLMNNTVVNKSTNITLMLLSSILKGVRGITSIAAFIQRYFLRNDDGFFDKTNTLFEWFIIIIEMADLSSSVLIRLNQKIKEINPKSSFIDAILSIKFEGDFKAFEKKCDMILSEEEIAIGSVNQAAIYCLIAETIDNYFNKQFVDTHSKVIEAISTNDFQSAQSALKILKPIIDIGQPLEYNQLIKEVSNEEYIRKGKKHQLTSPSASRHVSSKLLEKVEKFKESQIEEKSKRNEILIRHIKQKYTTEDISADELDILLRKGMDNFVNERIKKDKIQKPKDKNFKRLIDNEYNMKLAFLENDIKNKNKEITEARNAAAPAGVINRLSNELKKLNETKDQLFNNIKSEYMKNLFEHIEKEHRNRISDRMGNQYSYYELFEELKKQFINAGGDWQLLYTGKSTVDLDKAKQLLFEGEILKKEKLLQVKLLKTAGFTVSKYLYNIYKGTISLLPKRLLLLVYDNRVVSNFFDEILGFIAGIILGAEYLAKDEKLTSMSEVVKQYISTELASEDPFVNSVFEDNKLVLDEKYKEKKEEDVFNIFTADKNFEELEKIHNKEILAQIVKKKVEKAESKKKPRGVAFITGGETNLPGIDEEVINETAEKVIGKNVNQIRRIAETGKDEIKKDIIPTLTGMYSNVIVNKVESKYKDPWNTGVSITKSIKDKIHRLLCYLSAKSQYISIHFTSTTNIILALLYFQSKFADSARIMYERYRKNIKPGAKFESFCEWTRVSGRFSSLSKYDLE